MSLPEYPAALPAAALGVEYIDRAQLAKAPGLQELSRRKRPGGRGGARVRCSWVMAPAEMAVFRTFYESTLAQGAYWFTMSLPGRGGLSAREVRFTDEGYEASEVALGIFAISAELETRAGAVSGAGGETL